jgi:hypothetical protein
MPVPHNFSNRPMLPNRRVKTGAFFTPQIWAEKALHYFTLAFGKNWQEKYIVWDCAAGTGNLLDGLSNRRNIFASTFEIEDVQTIKEAGKLFENNVFQFDFLNDAFVPISQGGKVPDALYKFTAEMPQQILFFINPPYNESGDGKGSRENVSNENSKIKDEMRQTLDGNSAKDLAYRFIYRIKRDFPKSKLGIFCVPKWITGTNFKVLRQWFTATFKRGFVVPARTFYNVKGEFPITFTIWDLNSKTTIDNITTLVDVFNDNNEPLGTKAFYATNYPRITKWTKKAAAPQYGGFWHIRPDFNNQDYYHICDDKKDLIPIDNGNIIQMSIALSVMLAITDDWRVHQDQFFAPKRSWRNDIEFQNDCLFLTAFHQKNYAYNWIPFTEKEIHASVRFASNDFVHFLKKRLKENPNISAEAKAVFNAAKAMWKYAYTVGKLQLENPRHCDISLPFLEPNNKRMKITDTKFAALNDEFNEKRKVLNGKIIPKIYEHGFLSLLPPTGIPDINSIGEVAENKRT